MSSDPLEVQAAEILRRKVGRTFWERVFPVDGANEVLPPQPKDRLAEVLSAGDLHIVPLKIGADSVMWPSKVVSIKAVSRPIVAVGWNPGNKWINHVPPRRLADEIAGRAGIMGAERRTAKC